MKVFKHEKEGFWFNSLRMQLMLYFIGVSIVVLSIGTHLTYKNMVAMLEQRNEELILQQFNQTEQNITNLLEEVDRLSSVFIYEENIQRFLELYDFTVTFENVEILRSFQKKVDEIIFNYPYIDSIYIFTEDMKAIGASKNYSLVVRNGQKEHPFFTSEMSKEFKGNNIQSKWHGGYTTDFFNEVGRLDNNNAKYLITQVKYVRAISNPNRSALLVFNIDERYLFSLYGILGNDNEGGIYVIDDSLKILSTGDEVGNSTIREVYDKVEILGQYGSIVLQNNQSPKQVIYYKMQNFDWYLIKEVPLRINHENIKTVQRIFIITLLLSIFVIFITSFFWLRKITNPLNRLASKMTDLGQGNLGLTLKNVPKNEFGIAIKRFNEMSINISELINRNEKSRKKKGILKLKHFKPR